MNESDKNWLRISYHDIRAAVNDLFYSIKFNKDDCNICTSMYVKILHIKDFIDNASDLFEKSAVSEGSDYKRFYGKLHVLLLDLHLHIDAVGEVPVGSVIKKGIEKLIAVFSQYRAVFGYSNEAKSVPDSVSGSVPGSYFTQYDFTLPVSLGSLIETDERINPENSPISAAG